MLTQSVFSCGISQRHRNNGLSMSGVIFLRKAKRMAQLRKFFSENCSIAYKLIVVDPNRSRKLLILTLNHTYYQ